MRKIFLVLHLFIGTYLFADFEVDKMSLEEKVGQVLMVNFRGDEANLDAETLIKEVKVGSIIYYNWANTLESPLKVQKLSRDLQKMASENESPIPLLIAVDQEGGEVVRLKKGFTQFPGNRALNVAQDEKLAEEVATVMAKELKAVGVNMNLAPVLDIASQKESAIGIRSLGSSPEVVTWLGMALLKGYNRSGIITSLKHFPGHGDVTQDSHEFLPCLLKTKDEIQAHELIPFKALSSHSPCIMTGHILVPAFDEMRLATLSEPILEGLLRKEMGYKGVIISDSLVMQGVLKSVSNVDEGAILAFKAGCDMLLLGGRQLVDTDKDVELKVSDVKRIKAALINEVKEGRISEERLNQSVERILNLKRMFPLALETSVEEIKTNVFTKEHQKVAEKVALNSVVVLKKKNVLRPYERVAYVGPSHLKERLLECGISLQGFEETLKPHDAVVIFSANAWKNRQQQEEIKKMLQNERKALLVVVRDECDADLFPGASAIVTTSGLSQASIKRALILLKK